LLFDDAQEQRFRTWWFLESAFYVERRVSSASTGELATTNPHAHDRQSWIKLAKDYGYESHGLYSTSSGNCVWNETRTGPVVAEDIMRKDGA